MAIPHGLMFHRFHESGTCGRGQGSLTEIQFENILQAVGTDRILPPHEWLARTKAGALKDGDLCITFDDGLRSQFDVALPVLNRHGLKAFWFIYSSVFDGGIDRSEIHSCFATSAYSSFDAFVSNLLETVPLPDTMFEGKAFTAFAAALRQDRPFYSEADVRYRFVRSRLSRRKFERTIDGLMKSRGIGVREVAEGLWIENDHLASLAGADHVVGLHSYDHPSDLARLPPDEQRQQYQRNYDHIARVTGRVPESMSHPLNSYSSAAIEILSHLGIVCGFRSNMMASDQRGVNPTALEFARKDAANLVRS